MDHLQKFILSQSHLFPVAEGLSITKLFGQASARQYFRVFSPITPSTFIIMKMPQGFASPAEEVTKTAAGAPQEFSFLNVQRYLHQLGVAVPRVLAIDAEAGLVLLEDLGDVTLESLVKDANGSFFEKTYQKALDLLIDLQSRTAGGDVEQKECVAYYRFFNTELLNWEFLHFLEYGIEDRFQIRVNDDPRAKFIKFSDEISTRIQNMPKGFVHRDFQSRNIMCKQDRFYVIDFQDALVGPCLYDVVALLCDSYIWFTSEQQQSLLDYYVDHVPAQHPYHGKKSQAQTDFSVLTLQRKLKDTGRFQYIHTVRGNSAFLIHVPWSLEYVKRAFVRLPEYAEFQNLISNYVAELSLTGQV